MGQSSSQPLPHSSGQRVSTSISQASPAARPPRYSPTMDDTAASQQLLDEEARSENKNASQDEPASPPLSNVSVPSTPHEVEVPDSQLAPVPGSGDPAISPVTSPEPSSFAIPASVPKLPSDKKGKKRLREEADTTEQRFSNDHEDMATGAAEISAASVPQKKRRRSKKSYATPSSTGSGSERNGVISEQNLSTILSGADIVEGAATTTPRMRKRKNLARESTGKKPLSYSVDAEDGAAGEEAVVGRVPCVKRLKKSKSSTTTKQPTNEECDLEPSKETSGMDPIDPDAEQTSAATRRTKKTSNSPLVLKRSRSMRKEAGNKVPSDQPGPDAMPQDTDVVEDKASDKLALTETPKGKGKRKPLQTNTPRRRYTRKSNFDTTRAERELNTFRDLSLDPERPSSGPFTEDENELLRRAVRDYQQRNRLDTETLVSVIQWADPSFDPEDPRQRKNFTEQEMQDLEESKAFWDDIMNSQPSLNRSREIIKKHVHAQFSNSKKGKWTVEEDEELTRLVGRYGNNWKVIAYSMEDRDGHDCLNRWKDYLQFGDSRNVGRWTAEEERALLKALTAFVQKDENERDAAQLPPRAEYLSGDIAWGEVVEHMGKIRSRLQCSVKWDYMKAQGNEAANIRPVYRRGRTPDPNQPVDRTSKKNKVPATPRGRPPKSETGGDNTRTKTPKTGKASRKSTPHARPETDVEASGTTKRRGRPRKSEAGGESAAPKMPKKAHKSRKSNPMAADAALDEVPDTPQTEHAATPRTELAATPAPSQSVGVLQTRTAGVEQMLWGDKFDLVSAIAGDVSIFTEEDVDWRKISESLNNIWSVRVLQAALKELLTTVEWKKDFITTVVEVFIQLGDQRSHDELKEHYDPFQEDALADGNDTKAKGS